MPEALEKPNSPGLWAWWDSEDSGTMRVSSGVLLNNVFLPGKSWKLLEAAAPELPKVEVFTAKWEGEGPFVFVDCDELRWRYDPGRRKWILFDDCPASCDELLTDIQPLHPPNPPVTREVAERVARRIRETLGKTPWVEAVAELIMEELG